MSIQKKYEKQNFVSEKAWYLVMEIVNLVLGEGGISCSYSFLGICEAIFKGRDLIFRVEPHISI